MEFGGQHFAGTCTRFLLTHVAARAGDAAVGDVLRLAGETRSVEELNEDGCWSSYAQFRALLEAAGAVLGGPRSFDDLHQTVKLIDDSMPEAAELLQALGSPTAAYRATAHNNGIVSVMTSGEVEEISATEVRLGHRLLDGFAPFPEFCSFMTGVDGLGPKLFGYRIEVLEEVGCLFEGDAHCTVRVRWSDDGEASEIEMLRLKLGLAERRMEAFRETVSSLVSDDDLETVLQRVVSSAARAMRAPAFVLALEPLPWRAERVFAHGIDPDEATRVAADVLAGSGRSASAAFVVDVESTKRRYGRLAVIGSSDKVADYDVPVLRAYARLAATALDSATALEESRRQAAGAKALLALSSALTEITSTEQMAANVARATPIVIDCDFAAVALLEEGDIWRITGTHGFPPALDTHVRGMEIRVDDQMSTTFAIRTVDTADTQVRALMDFVAAVALARVPVVIDGAVAGSLIVGVREDPARLAENPEIEEQLRGLAGQVSSALRNARLVDQIRHQALHDGLTGLPNRTLVLDRAEHLLRRGRREQSAVAALFIDLDGFKDVNDSFGHAVGDQLLRAVAARLTAAVRGSDTIARLGGDEFVVLTGGAALDAGAELVAERILDVLREPFLLEGRTAPLTVRASIGIAVGDRATAGELLRDADVALYQAKAAGKSRYVLFAPEMQTAVTDRLSLETDLRGALEREEFFLVYQPIHDLRCESITGVEALVRWRHAARGIVAPDTFIRVLEETGMIDDVGRWVLFQACRQAVIWHAEGFPIDISVNVSARQLEHDRLVGDIAAALASAGLPATSLIIEVTETAIMRDAEATAQRLQAIKELGVRIAIDDFGTGYSSLAYLRQFPVDALKIDRSFISAMADSPEAGALIHTLVQLGKTLGLETLAEGIEERHQVERLQREDCDSGQGFLFAAPVEPDELRAILAEVPGARQVELVPAFAAGRRQRR